LRFAVVTTPSEYLGRGEITHRVSKTLCCAPQLDYLGQLHGTRQKAFGVRPNVGRVQVCGDWRNENALRKKGRLEVGLRSRDKMGKLINRHRERDAILAFARAEQDADDLFCLAVNHNAAACAAA